MCINKEADAEAEMPKVFKPHCILTGTIQSCFIFTRDITAENHEPCAARGDRCTPKLTLCLGGNRYIPKVSSLTPEALPPSISIQMGAFSLFLFFEKCLSHLASEQALMG